MEKKDIKKVIEKVTDVKIPHIHPYSKSELEESLTEALHQALIKYGVKSCTCIYDCDNCGAKDVKPISMGNQCCPKCYS